MGINPIVWAVNNILAIPLVLGAELKCSCGSKHRFLLLETDDIAINGLPKACVDDSKPLTNIRPFGTCSDGSPCKDCMQLEAEWENPEPQTELVNGKEIITTKSFLLCNAKGGTIEAVTSGQEHGYSFQMALMLFAEMEKDYPGLMDQLLDPHGSLYLEEGMYKDAIKFLEDYLNDNNGEILLAEVYDMKKPEDLLVVAVLDRLLTDCDGSIFEQLINGLDNAGSQTGIAQKEGWDVLKLNQTMIDMLYIDCKATSEKINTSFFARWTEEHKKFVRILGDSVLDLAYTVMIYRCITASEMTRAANKAISYEIEQKGLETLSIPNSKVLRQNLIEAGVEVPNYRNAAHHIITGNSPKAAEASYHPSLHTNAYYDKVNKLLQKATCKEDVLDILDFISEELQKGTFMQ